jgi:hypothetical protein
VKEHKRKKKRFIAKAREVLRINDEGKGSDSGSGVFTN